MNIAERIRKDIDAETQRIKDHLADTLLNRIAPVAQEELIKLINALAERLKASVESWLGEHKIELAADPQQLLSSAPDSKKTQLNPFKKLEEEIRKGLEKLADQLSVKLTSTSHTLANELSSEARSLEKKIRQTADSALAEAISETIRAAAKETSRATAKLKEILDQQAQGPLENDINQIAIPLHLGPVSMTFSNGYKRINKIVEALDNLANNQHIGRKAIIAAVDGLAPDNIDIDLDAQLALVIGSKDAGIGIGIHGISNKLIEHVLDEALEAIGIPE